MWAALAAVWLAIGVALAGEDAASRAWLTYTKVLAGSMPEYLSIVVDSNGESIYEGRKLVEAPNPRSFRISAPTVEKIFQLAAQLQNFESIDLESHKKVANLGLKSFTYEQGGRKNRAEFNYTLRRKAQQLMEVFEKLANVQQHLAVLEYAIKYDPLRLPQQLRQIQIDLDRQALAEPELLVPALEQIARNRRFLNVAQARAKRLLARIQNGAWSARVEPDPREARNR